MRSSGILALVVLFLLTLSGGRFHEAVAATSPDEMLENPQLEHRARELGKELRCLVCQNQSIDDSDATLARDLRLVVREQLLAGRSDDEIKAFMVERYGDFVLLKPPVKPATWLLWTGPFTILAVAAFWVWQTARRRQQSPGATSANEVALDDEERAELNALLGGDGKHN
jgi:cytochrome c-type biogenesis protein CcmH